MIEGNMYVYCVDFDVIRTGADVLHAQMYMCTEKFMFQEDDSFPMVTNLDLFQKVLSLMYHDYYVTVKVTAVKFFNHAALIDGIM